MFKSYKSIILFFVVLLLLLIFLCVYVKKDSINASVNLASSNVTIVKKDSIVELNGVFSNNSLLDDTIKKLKMFNQEVIVGDTSINNNIQNDNWKSIVDNLAYYFSNNLENGKLKYQNNSLSLSGTSLSKNAKDDMLNVLSIFQNQGIRIVSDFELIEAKSPRQKIKKDIYDLLYSKTIEFETGKSIIKEEAYTLLDAIITKLKMFPSLSLEIVGHTDNVGESSFNKKLSLNRAKSIKNYFVNKGIKEENLSVIGYGETRPAFPNNTNKNRQKNRRVEFKVRGE